MPIAPGIYRHYKGTHYWVIGVGVLHDTKERIVVYTSSLAAAAGQPLLRYEDEFTEPVAWPDGETRPRFVWESY